MIRNYLSITLRNIRQNLFYSFINIFSLAIGLAACIVIYLFVSDESSFDKFHAKKDSIYRLNEIQHVTETNVQQVALTTPGMGPYMVADFPEVKNFTRFWNLEKRLVRKGDKQLIIENAVLVDSTFLEIFDFELLKGDRNTALDKPFHVILTEETALKFFPTTEEALNNLITIRDSEYTISGVLKSVPENSHLKFDALMSITGTTSQDKQFNDRWGSNFLNTYLVIQEGADIKALESKLPDFLIRHTGDRDFTELMTLFLQPLEDVHLASMEIEHDYNNYRKFNGRYLRIFTMVGAFILVIAAVNFMNLTTARSSRRWKEIGVRSSIGARKNQLFVQFILESVVLALFSLMVAFILDLVFVPMLNNILNRQLSVSNLFNAPYELILIVAFTLLLGVFAGIYPALYMTSFKMSAILKGATKTQGKSVFRNSLVVLQFGLALAMIVSTLIVLQQLSFMQNKDIGFDKDRIILLGMNKEVNEKFLTLKEEFRKSKFVEGVTASGQRLGNNFHQWGFKVKADTGVVRITPSNVNVDFDYLKVYGIKLKEGRGFSRDVIRDNGYAFVINESFAKELRLKETVGTPAGHSFYKDDSLGTIIGVVEDFNFNSLHHKVNSLSMVVHPEWGYDEISIKINGVNPEAAIADVKNIWDKTVSYPFSYTFLDQHFDNLYRSDKQMSSVVTVMAVLAILISCLGLFGLVTITTETKIKEIGIRKALGATEFQITAMLSRNFMILVMVSFVLAAPVTWWGLSLWLSEFAFRISINPLVFLLGGFLALVVALLTISYHTLKSARANPVKALRYE